MRFTEEEKELLSDGLLKLLENAGKARALVHDMKVQNELEEYMKRVQELNTKVCMGTEEGNE